MPCPRGLPACGALIACLLRRALAHGRSARPPQVTMPPRVFGRSSVSTWRTPPALIPRYNAILRASPLVHPRGPALLLDLHTLAEREWEGWGAPARGSGGGGGSARVCSEAGGSDAGRALGRRVLLLRDQLERPSRQPWACCACWRSTAADERCRQPRKQLPRSSSGLGSLMPWPVLQNLHLFLPPKGQTDNISPPHPPTPPPQPCCSLPGVVLPRRLARQWSGECRGNPAHGKPAGPSKRLTALCIPAEASRAVLGLHIVAHLSVA